MSMRPIPMSIYGNVVQHASILLVAFCAGGCVSYKTQLISEEVAFKKLCGTEDELSVDCPLFKKGGTDELTFQPDDPNDRNSIAVIPKGTKVTIANVYRRQSSQGCNEWEFDYPKVTFIFDGKIYENIETRFICLEENRDVGFPRWSGK